MVQKEQGIMVEVRLSDHLQDLAGREARKLSQKERREVPNLTELADSIGVHRVTLTNIANGRVKRLSLKMLGDILNELRDRGFDSDIGDILKAVPRE